MQSFCCGDMQQQRKSALCVALNKQSKASYSHSRTHSMSHAAATVALSTILSKQLYSLNSASVTEQAAL